MPRFKKVVIEKNPIERVTEYHCPFCNQIQKAFNDDVPGNYLWCCNKNNKPVKKKELSEYGKQSFDVLEGAGHGVIPKNEFEERKKHFEKYNQYNNYYEDHYIQNQNRTQAASN